jgi:hypothetical protein
MTTFSHIVCLHAKATVEPSSYFIQMLLCLRATSTVGLGKKFLTPSFYGHLYIKMIPVIS